MLEVLEVLIYVTPFKDLFKNTIQQVECVEFVSFGDPP